MVLLGLSPGAEQLAGVLTRAAVDSTAGFSVSEPALPFGTVAQVYTAGSCHVRYLVTSNSRLITVLYTSLRSMYGNEAPWQGHGQPLFDFLFQVCFVLSPCVYQPKRSDVCAGTWKAGVCPRGEAAARKPE